MRVIIVRNKLKKEKEEEEKSLKDKKSYI